ncbi:GNAT family N-acetyltransferase [Candidatus Micrarchaeota archaeon]|nr:GNAT family N-acetyltransferase [Candidatus Micrarchaeota archaeon]
MKPAGKIMESGEIYLCYLKPEQVTSQYVEWLNDKTINQYLEVRFAGPHTKESTIEFVKNMYEDPDNHLFAIMLKNGDRHIGNIKVGPVNKHHNFAEVGILIGERGVWGKGYGTAAITMATQYAFEKLNIHKLIAGFYEPNIGSRKAFEKAGYKIEGNVKQKFLHNGTYVDDLICGKINEKWKKDR